MRCLTTSKNPFEAAMCRGVFLYLNYTRRKYEYTLYIANIAYVKDIESKNTKHSF